MFSGRIVLWWNQGSLDSHRYGISIHVFLIQFAVDTSEDFHRRGICIQQSLQRKNLAVEKKRNTNFSIVAVISTSWRMSTSDLGIQIPGEENLSFLRQWRWNSLGWKDLWLERQWWRRFRVAWRIPLNWSELVRFKLQVTENCGLLKNCGCYPTW